MNNIPKNALHELQLDLQEAHDFLVFHNQDLADRLEKQITICKQIRESVEDGLSDAVLYYDEEKTKSKHERGQSIIGAAKLLHHITHGENE